MRNDDHWDFDLDHARDDEREPTRHRARRKPRTQLTSAIDTRPWRRRF
jgi:hypothetical protein